MTTNNKIKTTLIIILNRHLIWSQIVNKSAQGEEDDLESYLSSCYNLVNQIIAWTSFPSKNINRFKEWIEYRDSRPLG